MRRFVDLSVLFNAIDDDGDEQIQYGVNLLYFFKPHLAQRFYVSDDFIVLPHESCATTLPC